MKKTIFLVFRAAGSNPKASGFGIIGVVILLVAIAYCIGENSKETRGGGTVVPSEASYKELSENSDEQCSEGEELVAGHCCWPGQDWGEGAQACFGEPTRCPEGYIKIAKTCTQGCFEGKVLVAGHCCWPGQEWGKSAQKCIGKPEMPSTCSNVISAFEQKLLNNVSDDVRKMCIRWKKFKTVYAKIVIQKKKRLLERKTQCEKAKAAYKQRLYTKNDMLRICGKKEVIPCKEAKAAFKAGFLSLEALRNACR